MLLHELSFINKNEATYQEDMSFEWFFNITISLYVMRDVLLGEKKRDQSNICKENIFPFPYFTISELLYHHSDFSNVTPPSIPKPDK